MTVLWKARILQEHAFPGGQRIRIGRARDNDIHLDSVLVSRTHAQIVWIERVCHIEDLHSTDGTLLNGASIDVHPLNDRDILHIGRYSLLVRLKDDIETGPDAASSTDRAETARVPRWWHKDRTVRCS